MAKKILSRLFKKSKPRRPSVLMERLDGIDLRLEGIERSLAQQQKQAAQPPTLARVGCEHGKLACVW